MAYGSHDFAILINSVTDATQTSVVRWSVDIRAARRAQIAGARHDCQSKCYYIAAL